MSTSPTTGVIVEDGPPAQLFGDPQKERTRAFLEQVAVKTHARVAVIGGGVVGASVLYHLAKRRLDRRRADRARRAHLGLDLARRRAACTRSTATPTSPSCRNTRSSSTRRSRKRPASRAASTSPRGVNLAGTPERMDFLKLACARARYLGLDMEMLISSTRRRSCSRCSTRSTSSARCTTRSKATSIPPA